MSPRIQSQPETTTAAARRSESAAPRLSLSAERARLLPSRGRRGRLLGRQSLSGDLARR